MGRWDSVWLHEGFARYSEALWQEHKNGQAAYLAKITKIAETLVSESMTIPQMLGLPALEAPEGRYPIMRAADPGVELMYLPTYEGGALTLHALRAEVGDEIFFNILRTYYQRYRDIPVTTEDFTALAEEVAGRDLSSVWDAWLHGTILPVPVPTLQPTSE